MHTIVRLFEPLLRFLLPPTGRHRLASMGSNRALPDCGCLLPLCTEYIPTARAYLMTDELRLQRHRRRALWLAVHGVDVGARRIHGVKVAR
ncbi:hypothetical protein GCM10010431_27880 [Streptomyces kunmingensis]